MATSKQGPKDKPNQKPISEKTQKKSSSNPRSMQNSENSKERRKKRPEGFDRNEGNQRPQKGSGYAKYDGAEPRDAEAVWWRDYAEERNLEPRGQVHQDMRELEDKGREEKKKRGSETGWERGNADQKDFDYEEQSRRGSRLPKGRLGREDVELGTTKSKKEPSSSAGYDYIEEDKKEVDVYGPLDGGRFTQKKNRR
jgi:hypothetical protein